MRIVHRRENLGEILKSMLSVIYKHEDIKVIHLIYMTPLVRETANSILRKHNAIRIIDLIEVTSV